MPIVVCPKCGGKNRVDERARTLRPVCGRCGTALPVMENTPRVVSDQSFAQEILGEQGRPVLLDCWAPWCGPCRMLAPTIEQLAAESEGNYVVAKLNTDENPGVAGQFQVDSIPTMLIFHNGQLVDRLVGLQPKHLIAARLHALSAQG